MGGAKCRRKRVCCPEGRHLDQLLHSRNPTPTTQFYWRLRACQTPQITDEPISFTV